MSKVDRFRSLFTARAVPGWLVVFWEMVDHISRAEFAASKGATIVKAVFSFLSAHPGFRLFLGIAWLTLAVLWPKKRKEESTISKSAEGHQFEESLANLSAECGKVANDSCEALKAYLAVLDDLLDRQLRLTNWRMDRFSQNIQDNYAEIARRDIDQDPALAVEQKSKILREMTANVAADSADTLEKKQKIATSVSLTKNKGQEILNGFTVLSVALKEIDRAIQLKRDDKLQAKALAEKLRTIQEKIQAVHDEVKT